MRLLSSPSPLLAVSLAVLASLTILGCDGQEPDAAPLSARVVGGETVEGRYLAGSMLAIEFTNGSRRTLAYDICSTWLESEAGKLESWGPICFVAPQLRTVEPGEAVVDSFGISERAPSGRYRYVFRAYAPGYDSLANVTTEVFDVVAAP